ncbi:uncharacterized protein LOC103697397 isoform X2 [Phoenix dactylifera]|uniref:Uncharacterized protein LOC103697397 isoform X2 n=1 Tax=Phoenix dactylifera TaxID=42345 RepID=A0A8B8ZJ43_PHODC|nr:uncharacterized protein LOC103697397 isoform X2 [Phoenix dactylifera]
MAESSTSSHPVLHTPVPASNMVPLVAVNASSQLPLKLMPTNFPSWRAQFVSLLVGYDLMGYIDGTIKHPSIVSFSQDDASAVVQSHWLRQDKLILHAILSSVSESIIPLIAMCETSHEAWMTLTRLYANKSRSHVMQLKESLSLAQRGSSSVTEYLQLVKGLADELAAIDAPLSSDDLTLYVLNGLGSDFRDIVAPIRAREKAFSFEELHDLLVSHEMYLRHLDSATNSLVVTANTATKKPFFHKQSHRQQNRNVHTSPQRFFHSKPNRSNVVCQWCNKVGHSARTCRQMLKAKGGDANANYTATSDAPNQKKWLMDSAASHNVTSDLAHMTIHSEYDGTDEVVIGDGSGSKNGSAASKGSL